MVDFFAENMISLRVRNFNLHLVYSFHFSVPKNLKQGCGSAFIFAEPDPANNFSMQIQMQIWILLLKY